MSGASGLIVTVDSIAATTTADGTEEQEQESSKETK